MILLDGRWFIKCMGEVGFETATKLNLAVNSSIGKTEGERLIAEMARPIGVIGAFVSTDIPRKTRIQELCF
jgi:predicted MarR family transcription regulator